MNISDFCYIVIFILYGAGMFLWGHNIGLRKAKNDLEKIMRMKKHNS